MTRTRLTAGRVFAVVLTVALLTQVVSTPALSRIPGLPYVLVAGALLLLLTTVVNLRLTTTVLAVAGVVIVALQAGLRTTLGLVALAALLLWILGLIVRRP